MIRQPEVGMQYVHIKSGKEYTVIALSKVKIDGQWLDAIVYQCNYENPEGMIWVRLYLNFVASFQPKRN